MTSNILRILSVLLTVLLGSLLLAAPLEADTIVVWQERYDGQLSPDPDNPTWVGALGEGDNVVFGKVGGGADRFLFDIGDGLEIERAFVQVNIFGREGVAELSLSDLTQTQIVAVDAMGTTAFGDFESAGAGTYLAEIYGLEAQSPLFFYEWHLGVGEARPFTPHPEPATLALVGLGALGLAARARRRRRAG